MKKINLCGISEILSEKEMKNAMGGFPVTCSTFSCSCKNGASNPPFRSAWTDCYGSTLEIIDAINQICTNGGSCA